MTDAEAGDTDEAVHLVTIDWTPGQVVAVEGEVFARAPVASGGRGQAEGIRLSGAVAQGLSRSRRGQPGEHVGGGGFQRAHVGLVEHRLWDADRSAELPRPRSRRVDGEHGG